VLAIADDLTEDGFVLRYRTGETDDGLEGKEGSFLICSFWLVIGAGDHREMQRARDLMEKLLNVRLAPRPLRRGVRHQHRPPPRELPQAFSHLALIEAAARIIVAETLAELS
jgi:GH15 family glucan-1,4-alpha-glucosidase